MPSPYYIAISGLMGSGKTTLIQGLNQELGWVVAPNNNSAKSYLDDLFQNMERWAFEAQLGFLTNKALEVIDLVEKNKNFLLDRSIQEDYLVFAKYFYEKGKIDKRGYDTYTQLAEYFLSKIQLPDIIIHCSCKPETASNRIHSKRKRREYQNLYPESHVQELSILYDHLLQSINNCPLYLIDSEEYDFREKDIAKKIVEEILSLLQFKTSSKKQLDLFNLESRSPNVKLLQPIISVEQSNNKKTTALTLPTNVIKVPTSPYAYIAAPFTSKAVGKNIKKTSNNLFQEAPIHGMISAKSEFRRMLLGIAKNLKKIGINSLIPHRDVSKWGKLFVSPKEVYENCSFHVTSCSLFIGILAESNGSHYEFGLASALGKPIILIQCEEITNSYISQGISDVTGRVKILSCRTTSEISKLFSTPDFLRLVRL